MKYKFRTHLTLIWLLLTSTIVAQTKVSIEDPDTWTTSSLSQYVGQTITFTEPMVVTNNYYNGSLTIAPSRTFSPTNQALPLSDEYNQIRRHNSSSELTLQNITGYHRMGEKIVNLTVRVNSITSLTPVTTPVFVGNTRDDMLTPPTVDLNGEHSLLVCAFNLEYYLVENLGTGYGADNETESARQHQKIMDALSRIQADIFGFVEIEQGQTALRKLAQSLTAATGKQYSYIDDHGTANGSFTKSGYVYCTQTVKPIGEIQKNNTAYSNRKMVQGFEEIASGERFIFSINHFKAKSGTGTGLNADQGDGQGIFNNARLQEARSILSYYEQHRIYFGDDDLLVMGDLNAYAKEDPIMALIDGGMTDLHRYFHQDSSYSYTFHGQAGYLDHALANSSLLPYITGMAAWHINSDEHDRYTYDKSSDATMFRSSDHDPILVGLRLGREISTPTPHINSYEVLTGGSRPQILNAGGGYYYVTTPSGATIEQGNIESENYSIKTNLTQGLYFITIYAAGEIRTTKLIVY